MKIGAVLAVILALGGIGLGIYAFVANASPYVSAKEAAAKPGMPVHVAGKILHETARGGAGTLQFDLLDDAGERMTVVYNGMKPGNFDSAPKASVSGSYKNGKFYADAVMTQCPSKYDSEKTDYLPSKK